MQGVPPFVQSQVPNSRLFTSPKKVWGLGENPKVQKIKHMSLETYIATSRKMQYNLIQHTFTDYNKTNCKGRKHQKANIQQLSSIPERSKGTEAKEKTQNFAQLNCHNFQQLSADMAHMNHGRLYVNCLPKQWTEQELWQWVKNQGIPVTHVHLLAPGQDMRSAFIHVRCPQWQLEGYAGLLQGWYHTHRPTKCEVAPTRVSWLKSCTACSMWVVVGVEVEQPSCSTMGFAGMPMETWRG